MLYHACRQLAQTDLTFAEVWRRCNASTMRLVAALASVVDILVATVLLRMFNAASSR